MYLMKLAIITSQSKGVASYFIYKYGRLFERDELVILYNNGLHRRPNSKLKYFRKKFTKMRSIGFFGALNGLRMRKWYDLALTLKKKGILLPSLKEQKEIPVFEINSFYDDDSQCLFKQLNIDLGVSLGNPYIPEKFFSIPKYGCINIHHALLPDYQNAQSIIWEIFNLEKKMGYTIHKINKKIDKGDIILKESIDIKLYPSLAATVKNNYQLVVESSFVGLLSIIRGQVNLEEELISQSNGKKYTTPSIKQFYKILTNFKKLQRQINSPSSL